MDENFDGLYSFNKLKNFLYLMKKLQYKSLSEFLQIIASSKNDRSQNINFYDYSLNSAGTSFLLLAYYSKLCHSSRGYPTNKHDFFLLSIFSWSWSYHIKRYEY